MSNTSLPVSSTSAFSKPQSSCLSTNMVTSSPCEEQPLPATCDSLHHLHHSHHHHHHHHPPSRPFCMDSLLSPVTVSVSPRRSHHSSPSHSPRSTETAQVDLPRHPPASPPSVVSTKTSKSSPSFTVEGILAKPSNSGNKSATSSPTTCPNSSTQTYTWTPNGFPWLQTPKHHPTTDSEYRLFSFLPQVKSYMYLVLRGIRL